MAGKYRERWVAGESAVGTWYVWWYSQKPEQYRVIARDLRRTDAMKIARGLNLLARKQAVRKPD